MRDWLRRRSPKYWPRWYRIMLACSAVGAVLGGVLAWFGPGWGRYAAFAGVILCLLSLFLLESVLDGPDIFESDNADY
ncbi:hypothetical protein [Candidatus Palauibacter sp.]|uniref:hypothetical protein n=1 Tax=Candidatus Palauibacter sp. TaxID=3101350 RepID=UPI003B014312